MVFAWIEISGRKGDGREVGNLRYVLEEEPVWLADRWNVN